MEAAGERAHMAGKEEEQATRSSSSGTMVFPGEDDHDPEADGDR